MAESENDLLTSMKLHLCSTYKEYEEVRRRIKTIEDANKLNAMSEKYDKPAGKDEDTFDSSSEDEPVTLKELNYIDYDGPMVLEGISDTDHSESESQLHNTPSTVMRGGASTNTPSTMCGETSTNIPITTMCIGVSTNTPTAMYVDASTDTLTAMYVDASMDTLTSCTSAMQLGISTDTPTSAMHLEAPTDSPSTDTLFFSKNNKPTSKDKSRGEKSLGSNKSKKVGLKEKVDRFLDKYWLEKFNELKK